MKLFHCPVCKDTVFLYDTEMRYCHCRESYGRYLEDGVRAEMGGYALPIGISSVTFLNYMYVNHVADFMDGWLNQRDAVDRQPYKYALPFYWRKYYEDGSDITRIEL